MTTVEYTSKRGTKLYFTLGASLTIVLVVSMFLFPGPWSVFIYVAAFGLASTAVLMLAMGTANIYHRIKMQQIERQKARYFASHHHQNVFYDGQLLLPAAVRGSTQTETQTITPQAETLPRLLDVIATDKTAKIFVGPQQSGKTHAAAICAQSLHLPTLFIGLRDEAKFHYQNMTVYSEERRTGSVARGIDAAMQSLKNYEPQVIFIDDLINVGLLTDIEPLIVTLATQAMSHNKAVFFTVQATDKKSIGLNSYGAQLKNNFSVVEIPPPIKDAHLQVIGHSNIATLYEPGDWKNGEQVRLPGPVSFAPADKDKQFIADYFGGMSQREMIESYIGSKNDKTSQAWRNWRDRLGLPVRETETK